MTKCIILPPPFTKKKINKNKNKKTEPQKKKIKKIKKLNKIKDISKSIFVYVTYVKFRIQ
jgi:hypothetical protein